MKYKVEQNSHIGAGVFLIELIGTILYLNGLMLLLDIKIHAAIHLVISIAVAIGVVKVFLSSVIGRKIIIVCYSIMWARLFGKIIGYFTNNDIIWIILIGAVTFFISIRVHLSMINDNGGDYTITKIDD